MKIAAGFLFVLLLPATSFGAGLVNINTADAALLDTLPGIGPTIAGRIIDYRTAHGPFAVTADIKNVSGIGPSTYAQLAPLITVGDQTASAPASVGDTASTTPAAPGRAASPYVPPPAELSIDLSGDSQAFLDVPILLVAHARAKGSVDPSAQITWSFGDGSSGTGTEVLKTYRYPGTYLVTVMAIDGSTKARTELMVTVASASVRIDAVSGEGVVLANDAKARVDLSGWRLLSGSGFFRIPEGTVLLPETSVLFPYAVTGLPMSFEPVLLYPDGMPAARYSVPVPAQLPPVSGGSYRVQTVIEAKASLEPATRSTEDTSISSTAHEITSGSAPAAATVVAAAGAALSDASSLPAVLHSPWTLGLFGVMALAGGAFILL